MIQGQEEKKTNEEYPIYGEESPMSDGESPHSDVIAAKRDESDLDLEGSKTFNVFTQKVINVLS